MQSNSHLNRPTLAALLSLLLVVCIPYFILTYAAPEARAALLFVAFPLWTIGLLPVDRMMSRLLPISMADKPRKAPHELGDHA